MALNIKIYILYLVIIQLLLTKDTDSAKILLMPFNHGSHVNFFCKTGQTLQEAGHEVYVIVARKFEKFIADYHITPLIPNIKSMPNLVGDIWEKHITNPFVILPAALNVSESQVRETLDDKAFIRRLEDMKFDLMLIDAIDFARYFYILPYKLNLPFISLSPRPDPWTVRVPSLPSAEGMMPLFIMSEHSNVFHRVANTIAMIVSMIIVPPSPLAIVRDSVITELVPEKENIGFANLYHKSEMIIVNMDIICLDFHRVSSPYYQFVGGVGATDPKPLPEEFSKIVDTASDGIIVFSFGSGIKSIPSDMMLKLFNAFKVFKEKVIMRHTGEVHHAVPKNVHLSSWMPQNDLLGQPKTKLFITHVGNNGQLEAVYHGVPMLMMPLFGDQFYNSWRAELRGYGKTLSSTEFTTEELKETMTELIQNKTYSNNIKKCSKILHNLPSPQNQILFWVNHILEFGGSHLRPFYLDMPLWKLFMFDVMLVFAIMFAFFIFTIKFCYGKCCKAKPKKHEKKE